MQPFADVLELARALARASARHYLIVAGCVALFLAGAAGILAIRDPQYAASMTVAMTTADLTGRLVPPDSNARTYPIVRALMEEGLLPYLHLLQSHEVAELLVDHWHFDRVLFADDIDPQSGQWKPRTPLSRLIDGSRGEHPTAGDVQQALEQMLTVNLSRTPGLATVRCVSRSQTLCVALLDAVHRAAQFRLRQVRLDAALHARDVLKTTPAPDPDMRAARAARLMALDGDIATLHAETPVGAVVIERPFVPHGPFYPRPTLILLLALAMGLGAGVVLAWAIDEPATRPGTTT